jgi:hypothetical protein
MQNAQEYSCAVGRLNTPLSIATMFLIRQGQLRTGRARCPRPRINTLLETVAVQSQQPRHSPECRYGTGEHME